MIDYARQWKAACDAAYDPKTPPEELDRLARGDKSLNRGRSWQRGVASNPSAWGSTLSYLAGTADWVARSFMANNPNATAAVLIKIVRSGDFNVLENIILHHNATPEVFAAIVDPWIPTPDRRLMVAEYERAPAEILTQLASDESDAVRSKVAENPNTPPLVKLWLQSDRYGGMMLKEFLEATRATTQMEE